MGALSPSDPSLFPASEADTNAQMLRKHLRVGFPPRPLPENTAADPPLSLASQPESELSPAPAAAASWAPCLRWPQRPEGC